MAGTDNEPEVKDVERIEVTPAGADAENVDDDAETTDPDSSQEETDGTEPEADEAEGEDKPDELVSHPTAPATDAGSTGAADGAGTGEDDGLAAVPGETPRERALRSEVTRLKGKLRGDQVREVIGTEGHAGKSTELSETEKATIGKYKPEEVQALKEIFPVLAKEMGFVRKDELESSTFLEKSQDVLNTFLDKHPEYLPENDKDGALWDSFKSQYGLYKPPTNPKDFAKIFDKIHRDVFGIQPGKGALKTVSAQQQKAKSASHAGASSAPAAPKGKPATPNSSVRVDMLKGFSDEELADLTTDDE